MGCNAVDCHVGSIVVVSPEPLGRLDLSLLYCFKDVLVEPFVPHRAIVALDVVVLLCGLPGHLLDVCDVDAVLLGPSHQ